VQITNKDRFNEADLVETNINNKKYLEVLKTLVQPEHVWRTLKWVDKISENNKRVSSSFILILFGRA